MKSILFKGKALCTYYCRNGTNTIYVNVNNCLFKVFYSTVKFAYEAKKKNLSLSTCCNIFEAN